MKGDDRYVFDTNVIISALLFQDSTPGRAFRTALDRGHILVSLSTLTELSDVLGRKKFDRYLLREERESFLISLVWQATIVDVAEQVKASRDPADDKFLDVALSGHATCVVSGDEHLLELSPFRGIPIITPEAFLGYPDIVSER